MTFEDLLLSIDYSTSSGETAFSLVDICVTEDKPDGNSKFQVGLGETGEQVYSQDSSIFYPVKKGFFHITN